MSRLVEFSEVIRITCFILIRQMFLSQVMKLHGKTNFLHIGCDEVYHLGECSRCRKKLRDELFLTHVTTIAKYVRERYNAVPIIWDDMLRHVPSTSLEAFRIGELVEPMVSLSNNV